MLSTSTSNCRPVGNYTWNRLL